MYYHSHTSSMNNYSLTIIKSKIEYYWLLINSFKLKMFFLFFCLYKYDDHIYIDKDLFSQNMRTYTYKNIIHNFSMLFFFLLSNTHTIERKRKNETNALFNRWKLNESSKDGKKKRTENIVLTWSEELIYWKEIVRFEKEVVQLPHLHLPLLL